MYFDCIGGYGGGIDVFVYYWYVGVYVVVYFDVGFFFQCYLYFYYYVGIVVNESGFV